MNINIQNPITQRLVQIAAVFILAIIAAFVVIDYVRVVSSTWNFFMFTALMVLINYAGSRCYEVQQTETGSVLLFTGAILYGICLLQIFDLYHAVMDFSELLLFWWIIGIVPLVIVTSSVHVCLVLLFLSFNSAGDCIRHDCVCDMFPLATLVAIWAVYKNRDTWLLIMLLIGVVSWGVMIVQANDADYYIAYLGIFAIVCIAFLYYLIRLHKASDKWLRVRKALFLDKLYVRCVLPQIVIMLGILLYSLLPSIFGETLYVRAMPVHIGNDGRGVILDYATINDVPCPECIDVSSYDARKNLKEREVLYLKLADCEQGVCNTYGLVREVDGAEKAIKGNWDRLYFNDGMFVFKHINRDAIKVQNRESIEEYYQQDDAEPIVVELNLINLTGRASISKLIFPEELCATMSCP